MTNKEMKQQRKKYNGRNSYLPRRTQLKSVETVEGETIEQKIRRLVSNNEPITDGANPELYTERKDGVLSAYNIRTDRFEIATEAMDKVTKSTVAKREGKGKVIPLEKEVSEAKSTEGENGKEKAN